ncbi:hypothetical protein NDU88_003329 [Pleurodeles waltl]|uniref:Uncharacterized protein n=1 Tax=Pleurodeles waltl TaxID=8319 RepID=A0AAV7M4V6_PLEWA|nr:hypothetical protein NDU88_003329 [Pleurodeles waltl]
MNETPDVKQASKQAVSRAGCWLPRAVNEPHIDRLPLPFSVWTAIRYLMWAIESHPRPCGIQWGSWTSYPGAQSPACSKEPPGALRSREET